MLLSHFSRVRPSATSWTAAHPVSPSFTISGSLLKFIFIESVMPSNHLILYHQLLHLPSVFPSIRVFSNESVLHIRWPKYWSFSINPSNEYSRLISFRIDWFDISTFLSLGCLFPVLYWQFQAEIAEPARSSLIPHS